MRWRKRNRWQMTPWKMTPRRRAVMEELAAKATPIKVDPSLRPSESNADFIPVTRDIRYVTDWREGAWEVQRVTYEAIERHDTWEQASSRAAALELQVVQESNDGSNGN